MHPQDPIDDLSATGDPPRKAAGGLTVADYFVILVGCAFAIFYSYKASRENVPASTEQSQTTSRPSDQALPNPKSGSADVAKTAPSVAPTRAAAPAAQKVAPPAAPPRATGPTHSLRQHERPRRRLLHQMLQRQAKACSLLRRPKPHLATTI